MRWAAFVVVGLAGALLGRPAGGGDDGLAEELRADARVDRRVLLGELAVLVVVIGLVVLRLVVV